MINKLGSLFIRLSFATFIILTSFYCLLAYPSFTYQQVIKLVLVTWLPIFAKLHPYLYLLLSVLLIPSLSAPLKEAKTKKLAIVFLATNLVSSILLIFSPLLTSLENGIYSLVWCFITILPLFWLVIIDYLSCYSKISWATATSDTEDQHIFWSLLKTAIFITLNYFVVFQLRQVTIDFHLSISQAIFILTWSFSAHLLVFMAIFITLNLTRALARLSHRAVEFEFWLVQIVLVIFITLVFRNIVFSAISFTGHLATLASLVFASALVTFFSSLSVVLSQETPAKSGLESLLAPFSQGVSLNQITQVVSLVTLLITTYLLTIKFVALDWNFLLQKLIVSIIWLATFAIFYLTKSKPQAKQPKIAMLLLFAITSLITYKILTLVQNNLSWQKNNQTISGTQLLDKYVGYDVSCRLLTDILSPAPKDNSFYKFLQNSSNISQEIKINPIEVNLVNNLAPTQSKKPNIFIFTIDSLRQDYIGIYNRSVTFTPQIDAFARESIVMENAFTHYGATGLSEPSIWVGGMLLHKQYVTPFYPMNSLQKLLEADNYQYFMSIDSILETLVKPSSNITQIDKGISTQSLEFCRSLTELKDKIVNRPDKNHPIFVYTQPQNIHISVINRENRTVLDNGLYQNFYAPYASRIKQIDKCFGDFISFLKAQDLFDNSIIIFTADHGESLGEEGRFGHAYTIFPEILRIPMIIHLPNELKSNVVWDTKNIAFSADITPSLYYLLDHKPIVKSEILGKPLFTTTMDEQKTYIQDSYLVASSYGAVYGILSKNGQALYIADGVNFQDYFYDLANDPKATTNRINPGVKFENEKLIRQYIESINKSYQFVPAK